MVITLVITHLSSVGHLHAVEGAPSRNRHFAHKAWLQHTHTKPKN